MAIANIPFTWTMQPQAGATIDYGNPLARGLKVGWHGANPHRNLANGDHTYLPSGVDDTENVGRAGKSVRGVAGVKSLRGLKNIVSSTAYTVMTVVMDSSGRGAVRNPFDGDASGSGNRIYQLRFDADNTARFIAFNTAVGNFQASGTAASASDKISVLAGVVDAAQVATVYLNGIPGTTTATVTGTPKTLVMTDYLTIGQMGDFNNTTQTFTGDIFACFFWNRGLSKSEIYALSQNPWQLFAPVISVPIVWQGAAGGSVRSRYYYDMLMAA